MVVFTRVGRGSVFLLSSKPPSRGACPKHVSYRDHTVISRQLQLWLRSKMLANFKRKLEQCSTA